MTDPVFKERTAKVKGIHLDHNNRFHFDPYTGDNDLGTNNHAGSEPGSLRLLATE